MFALLVEKRMTFHVDPLMIPRTAKLLRTTKDHQRWARWWAQLKKKNKNFKIAMTSHFLFLFLILLPAAATVIRATTRPS